MIARGLLSQNGACGRLSKLDKISLNYVNPSIPKEKNGAEVFTKWVQTLERFRGGKDRKTH